MKQEEKQQWTERILNSARNLQQAVPTRDLYEGIEQRLQLRPVIAGKIIPLRTVSAAAAALLLLFAFNFFSMRHRQTSGRKQSAAAELVQYYQLSDDDALSGY